VRGVLRKVGIHRFLKAKQAGGESPKQGRTAPQLQKREESELCGMNSGEEESDGVEHPFFSDSEKGQICILLNTGVYGSFFGGGLDGLNYS